MGDCPTLVIMKKKTHDRPVDFHLFFLLFIFIEGISSSKDIFGMGMSSPHNEIYDV